MRCPSGKPRLGTGSGVPCKRVGTVHLAPTHLRLVTHYGGLPKFHVLVGLCGRLPYSEPTHVERRNEDEGQKRCDRQSAHDRAGHRPPEDGRCGRDHAEDGRGSGEQDRSEPMRAEMPSVAQIAAVPGSWLSTSSSQRGCAVDFKRRPAGRLPVCPQGLMLALLCVAPRPGSERPDVLPCLHRCGARL